MIETLDDIIEELADQLGVYGAGPENDVHPDDCDCRICFTCGMRERIAKAIEVERIMRDSMVRMRGVS